MIHFLIRDTLAIPFVLITAVINIRPLGVLIPISGRSPLLDYSGSRIVQSWLFDWTALVPVQESGRHTKLWPLVNPFGVFLTWLGFPPHPTAPKLLIWYLFWVVSPELA